MFLLRDRRLAEIVKKVPVRELCFALSPVEKVLQGWILKPQ